MGLLGSFQVGIRLGHNENKGDDRGGPLRNNEEEEVEETR